MDLELLAHFLRVRPEKIAMPGESGDHAGPLMALILERLSDCPAVVFSRSGEVLTQTPLAIALFGDHTRLGESSRSLAQRRLTDPAAREHHLLDAGVTGHDRLRRYRHAELGGLELYHQLLVDPLQHQTLLVFTAVPGSASEEKLRRLALAGD